MTGKFRHGAVVLSLLLLLGALAFAADKPQTFTGKISDSMCGAKHMEPGVTDAQCTRACVRQGAKYALVVGDKVYTLEGGDQAELDKLAGAKAKVTGTVNGNTIKVSSVAPAKA